MDDLAILVAVFENHAFKSRHSIYIVANAAILGMGISHSPPKTYAHKKEEQQKEQHNKWSKKQCGSHKYSKQN
jgi:hypothetical protein